MKLQSEKVVIDLICRSPHGERGLKYQPDHAKDDSRKSLPTRGAWKDHGKKFAADPQVRCEYVENRISP